jgi:hypothetical protein
MKNKLLFVISLAVLVFLAAACSKTETAAPKQIDLTIGPDDQAATGTPAPTPAEPAAPTAPAAASTPSATEPAATEPSKTEDNMTSEAKPSETETASSGSELPESICDEKETIGFVKCVKQASGDSELTVKNSGREDLDGVYIKYYKGADVIGSKSEMSSLSAGNSSTVLLELKTYSADKVEVFPVWNGNFCSNKQILIKPSDNCR